MNLASSAMFHLLMIFILMITVHSIPVAEDIHIYVDASGSRYQGMIPNNKRKEETEDGPIPAVSVSERPLMSPANEMDVVEDDAVHIWPWKDEKGREDDNEDVMRPNNAKKEE